MNDLDDLTFELDMERLSMWPGSPTQRTIALRGGPHGSRSVTTTILPDRITAPGGSYYPSVGPRSDGRPDWAAYFRAADGHEPMVYVWRSPE